MNRFFFDQTSLESRGRLYILSFLTEEGLCDPVEEGGARFCRVVALFRKLKSRR